MANKEEEKGEKSPSMEGESNLVFLHAIPELGEVINLKGMIHKFASRLENFAALIMEELDQNGAAIVMADKRWQSSVEKCLEDDGYRVEWSGSEKEADPELKAVENPTDMDD
jgi:hypothetical protein